MLEKAEALQEEVDEALSTLKQTTDALVKKTMSDPTADPTPDTNTPGKDDTVKVPAKGSKYTDYKKGLVYKVTKSDEKNGTVTVTGLTSAKKNVKKVTIPATVIIDGYTFKVTQVAAKAFQKRTRLTTVVISANITKIGTKAFYKDGKLKNITFKGTKVVKVGSNAFKGIKVNAKVTVPKKMSTKTLGKLEKAMKSAGKNVVFKKK